MVITIKALINPYVKQLSEYQSSLLENRRHGRKYNLGDNENTVKMAWTSTNNDFSCASYASNLSRALNTHFPRDMKVNLRVQVKMGSEYSESSR